MQTVVLVDYGSGNLRSAEKALDRAARDVGSIRIRTTSDPDAVAAADRVVLPGVGAFAACMALLAARRGLIEALGEAARRRGAPFLGVCVGMQLLASRGLEHGEAAGLGWIEGEVRPLAAAPGCKIPHMGWNEVEPTRPSPLLAGGAEGADMYFTHSFAFFPERGADVVAWTRHGAPFPSVVVRGNLAGVQFHPEKSQRAGLALIANFLRWRP